MPASAGVAVNAPVASVGIRRKASIAAIPQKLPDLSDDLLVVQTLVAL